MMRFHRNISIECTQFIRTGSQRIVQKAKSVLLKLSHAKNGTNHTTMSLVRIEYILLLVMLFAFCTALFLSSF